MPASNTARSTAAAAPFYALLAALGALVLAGLGGAWTMEHYGHAVTGMSNRIVWGTPHVFAVFLIVAASGALNVASIASVFGRDLYKPLARLSGLLAMTLLAGGLAVLVLDLGRPERLIVAMTHYNLKSIFAWNIFLYTGFFAVVAIYLWTMFERRMNGYSNRAGLLAFLWRLILTTGTGSIFGFLVAREPYNSALLAPLFIVMSFSFGLAIFVLVLMAACRVERPRAGRCRAESARGTSSGSSSRRSCISSRSITSPTSTSRASTTSSASSYWTAACTRWSSGSGRSWSEAWFRSRSFSRAARTARVARSPPRRPA